MGQKGGEEKSLDGVSLMLIDAIGVPAVDQLMVAGFGQEPVLLLIGLLSVVDSPSL